MSKRKRKINAIFEDGQTIAEKIEATREYLTTKIKETKLPELKKKLDAINSKLKKGFSSDQINTWRELQDQRKYLLNEIEEIKSDKKLHNFEEYIKTLIGDNVTQNPSKMLIFKSDINNLEKSNKRLKTNRTSGVNVNGVNTNDINSNISVENVEELDFIEPPPLINVDDINTHTEPKLNSNSNNVSINNNVNVHVNIGIYSHTWTPIKTIEEELASANNANSAHTSMSSTSSISKREVKGRKINELHERLIDSNLITPKQAGGVVCPICVKPLPLIHSEDEAILSCVQCGASKSHWDNANNSSQNNYFNIPKFTNSGRGYSAQFDSILANFDMQTWIKIPNEVKTDIRREYKMTNDSNSSCIDATKIRDILRKLKYKKYYPNIVQLYSEMNGKPIPRLTKEKKKIFRHYFRLLNNVLKRNKNEKKHISHPVAFKKICQLLKFKEFIPFIAIVKTAKSYNEQEKIWESICSKLGLVHDKTN